jgi:proteasome assembly chaperone (PAC2) family protein
MAEQPDTKPWLVAAWPGMGNVAVIAAGYLVHSLDMKPLAEVAPEGRFDVEHVEVKKGVLAPPRLPRSVFYRWNDPDGSRSLLVFLSEAQPSGNAYAYAKQLLEAATRLGAGRIMTFASMASQLHPSSDPRVFGAVTQPDMLADLTKLGVVPLEDGQIGGLNGVMLGAAAEKGLPGLCLLGEIPYFAAGVPNPKAAIAVLRAFAQLSGIKVDPTELAESAEAVDQALVDLLQRMREQGGDSEEAAMLPEDPTAEEAPAATEAAEKSEKPAAKPIDAASRKKIEDLFREAQRDRAKAVRLKRELDRLGIFKEFENRFLDLFRRAE